MRKLAVGDIHGNYKALMQCLERSKFDYKEDRLIVLGDICDGYPDTKKVIDELLKIKNLIIVWGNHDKWAYDWMTLGQTPDNWVRQGGRATLESFKGVNMDKYIKFFKRAWGYYIDEDIKIYMHGGIPQNEVFKGIKNYDVDDLIWDRSLALLVIEGRLKGKNFQGREFKEIYLGHTTTEKITLEPLICENVILLDQGAGWGGKLSMMDTDTHEFWQSDIALDLYPEHQPRDKFNR